CVTDHYGSGLDYW
nr:immunoglobulin heavy chain junction region [Macaca mulatta]